MNNLILPTSFEEVKLEFNNSKADQKLMELIEPIIDIEEKIGQISSEIINTGKLFFLLGRPGVGKSTFIKSLSWRTTAKLRCIINIDCSQPELSENLNNLYKKIILISDNAINEKDAGPTFVVIDYLENLENFEASEIKSFFRNLNGLLRKTPLLIIWPVTSADDVNDMKSYAEQVSTTMFPRGLDSIEFNGPSPEKYVDIAKRTISILNDGKELSEFALTAGDLEEEYQKILNLPKNKITIREYLECIKERWKKNSDWQSKIRHEIPKPNEVWFIFSYKDAESVVGQFTRKSPRTEDNWSVIHDKLYEYIPNSQRSARWDAKRLQISLYGAIKTRILFLPTNSLVSSVAAYSKNTALSKLIDINSTPKNWKNKKEAKRSFSNTPLYKQLVGDISPVGKRKGGPAAQALETADPIFSQLINWITTTGSDTHLNSCIAEVINDLTDYDAKSNITHPWLKNITPDIFIDLSHKQICIEFHYTNNKTPSKIADYVLEKLDVYMNEIEHNFISKKN